jgi:hypothetical protein
MTTDLIKNSAIAFKELLDKEYLLKIGRKRNVVVFRIIFENNDFKHLAGIGKLTDLPVHKMRANLVFINALNGKLTDTDLMASSSFHKITDRLEHLKNLEYYLDNNMMVFKWDRKKTSFSSNIIADYLLEEKIDNKPKAYVFLKENTSLSGKKNTLKISEIRQSAVSFFLSKADYSAGQVKFTLLKNEKMNKITGAKELLFDFEADKYEKK